MILSLGVLCILGALTVSFKNRQSAIGNLQFLKPDHSVRPAFDMEGIYKADVPRLRCHHD